MKKQGIILVVAIIVIVAVGFAISALHDSTDTHANSFTLTSPTAGTRLTIGTNQLATWNDNANVSGTAYSLQVLDMNNNLLGKAGTEEGGSNQLSWTVGTIGTATGQVINLPQGQYYIRVIKWTYDSANNTQVQIAVTPSISVALVP